MNLNGVDVDIGHCWSDSERFLKAHRSMTSPDPDGLRCPTAMEA